MSEQVVIHTIPIPKGWSPEQAWEAIKRNDVPLPQPPQWWTNIETESGRFVRVI